MGLDPTTFDAFLLPEAFLEGNLVALNLSVLSGCRSPTYLHGATQQWSRTRTPTPCSLSGAHRMACCRFPDFEPYIFFRKDDILCVESLPFLWLQTNNIYASTFTGIALWSEVLPRSTLLTSLQSTVSIGQYEGSCVEICLCRPHSIQTHIHCGNAETMHRFPSTMQPDIAMVHCSAGPVRGQSSRHALRHGRNDYLGSGGAANSSNCFVILKDSDCSDVLLRVRFCERDCISHS